MKIAGMTRKELSGVRVCVIDDDKDVINIVERILSARGYRTLGISQVIGSSSKVKKFKPHIIIMDIMMPVLDGHNLLEVFRKTLQEMPRVILFSGIHPDELEKIAIDARADDFVYKGDGFFRILGRVNLHAYGMVLCGKTSTENGTLNGQ